MNVDPFDRHASSWHVRTRNRTPLPDRSVDTVENMPRKARSVLSLIVVAVSAAALFATYALWQYSFCPIYRYVTPAPFSGQSLWNPYAGMKPDRWKKGSFQIHTEAWWGLTDGFRNSGATVDSVYRSLGYDFMSVTDYMKINTHFADRSWYVPSYEHGYSFGKQHYLVPGARRVSWLDYILPQDMDNKQDVIRSLRAANPELIAIAHPQLRSAFTPADMRFLDGYDCIEAIHPKVMSIDLWDSALSNGHRAYMLADDDAHNMNDPTEVGRCCMFVNTGSMKGSDIISAVRQGNAYGVRINIFPGEGYDQRRRRVAALPFPTDIDLSGDTLTIRMSDTAAIIKYFGQGGVVNDSVEHVMSARYVFRPQDTYIRTEVWLKDSSSLYLNPIFRYYPAIRVSQIPEIDEPRTWMKRSVGCAILLAGITLMFRLHSASRYRRRARSLALSSSDMTRRG
jgi:hypothetical protein